MKRTTVESDRLENVVKDKLVEFTCKGKQYKRTYLLTRGIWTQGNLHHNTNPILLKEEQDLKYS